MKYFSSFLICLLFFSSCLSDEEKRLQTDQAFEGEEMFDISYSLGEHVFYAIKPFEFYKDTSNYATISGCPLVTYSEAAREVSLVFGRDCVTNQSERKGKLTLTYLDSLVDQKDIVRINYEAYTIRGIKLEGVRLINHIASSPTQVTIRDELQDFILRYDNNSTSEVSATYNHKVVFAMDSILHITTTGSGSGRSLSGRLFGMEISQPRLLLGTCIRNGTFVPGAGQETWTFERTVESDAVHRILYEEAPDCKNTATIQLQDGRKLELTP